jgi:PhnB protein
MNKEIKTSIEPWFTVNSGQQAVAFYKSAFKAIETYRLENPGGGLVVRLSVEGAGFWISSEANESIIDNPDAPLGGGNVRMILTVENPDIFFNQAIQAGATAIFPVGEAHGWRLGRLTDPFGLHWEIGRQL